MRIGAQQTVFEDWTKILKNRFPNLTSLETMRLLFLLWEPVYREEVEAETTVRKENS